MKYIPRRPLWLTIGLAVTDGLFFGLTNPANVASILLIVGFVLFVMTVFWLIYNLQKLLAVYAPWLGRQTKLSLAMTAGIAALLALQSIGQLTARDSLLIPLTALALYAYFGYSQRTVDNS